MWWNYICYGYCINKNIKYYSNIFDCYTLHTVLLASTLLLTIIIICYHYAKQKCIYALTL